MEKTAFKNKYVLVKLLQRKGKPDYTIVKVRPGVVIVALTSDNRILFVRQYREPLEKKVLELPAGLKEKGGETIIQTAKRELLEETGFVAREWILLGKFNFLPNIIGTSLPVVLALDATRKIQQKLEEKNIEVELHTFTEAGELVKKGELTDAASIAAIYKARIYLKI